MHDRKVFLPPKRDEKTTLPERFLRGNRRYRLNDAECNSFFVPLSAPESISIFIPRIIFYLSLIPSSLSPSHTLVHPPLSPSVSPSFSPSSLFLALALPPQNYPRLVESLISGGRRGRGHERFLAIFSEDTRLRTNLLHAMAPRGPTSGLVPPNPTTSPRLSSSSSSCCSTSRRYVRFCLEASTSDFQ